MSLFSMDYLKILINLSNLSQDYGVLLFKVGLFLDCSWTIFIWLNFVVMLCYDLVCFDYKFELAEDCAAAIKKQTDFSRSINFLKFSQPYTYLTV